MTMTQIKRKYPEVAKLVYEQFPLSKAERKGCKDEKAMMEEIRVLRAKKLIELSKEKVVYGE